MPINITQPWNLSCSYGNATGNSIVGCIPHNVVANLPWYPNFMILLLYVALYIYWSKEPGKDKFILITFFGMLASWLYLMFGIFVLAANPSLPDYVTPTACTGLFFLTFVWCRATQ